MTRPQPDEYPDFYARYVDQVPEDDLLSAFEQQAPQTATQLSAYQDRPDLRYAPDKWSVKQVVGHLGDTERVFGFRALWFARRDPSPLPGFEQDDWMAASAFDAQPLGELISEFQTVRQANILLLRHLAPDAWDRRGVANGFSYSVRAYAYGLLGHERWHLKGLAEHYR